MAVLTAGFDVAVLGAGPAGSAAALELRGLGVERVLLAEASHFHEERIGESVPPDTRKLLGSLGLMPRFLEEGHELCLGSCSSWGAAELGYNDFAVNIYGSGWHLDRTRFDSFLARQAELNGADVRTRTRFTDFEAAGRAGFFIRLEHARGGRETVRARFVVDASGMKAVFARRMGARRIVLDRLVCVYGFFERPESAPVSQLTRRSTSG